MCWREHLSVATVLAIESRVDSCFNASDTEHTNIQYRYTQCEYNTVIIINSSMLGLGCGWGRNHCSAGRVSGDVGHTWGQLVLVALHSKLQAVNFFSCIWDRGTFQIWRRRRSWESIISSHTLSADWRNRDRCVTFGELLCGAQWLSQVGNTFLHRPQSVRRPRVCTQMHTETCDLTYSNSVCLCLYLRFESFPLILRLLVTRNSSLFFPGLLGFLLTKFDFKTCNYR